MAHVRKQGDKYLVGWRNGAGKQRWLSCPTEKIAGEFKVEIEYARLHGRDWEPAGRQSDEADLVEEVVNAYIDDIRDVHVRAPGTRLRHARALTLFERFLRQQQPRGVLSVKLLAKPTLADFAGWLRKPETGLHGRARGGETVRKLVEVVEVFWSWAESAERWPDIGRPRSLDLDRAPEQPVYAPTWAEMDACVEVTRGWQRQLVTWLRYSGLRVGESMMFTWSDLDLEQGVLSIRKEIAKGGVARKVPLSPHLIEEVKLWDRGAGGGYIIPCTRQKGPRERQVRSRDITRAWQRAGIPPEIWRQRPDHAFRRGFKTGMLALKGHPNAIDFLQGHSLGPQSSRASYIDPWRALPLVEVAALVPKIGEVKAEASKGGVGEPPQLATAQSPLKGAGDEG